MVTAETREIPDASWKDVATGARTALHHLGYQIVPRCFPGEPGHAECGGSWAEHAGSLLLTVKAVADHQLAHLGAPASWQAIYDGVTDELEHGCNGPTCAVGTDPARPQDG